MTSRERLIATLNHRQPDRVVVDFGATYVTGIAASTLAALRKALLDEPDYRVKVHEPYQMLGLIDDKLRDVLGIDTVMLSGRRTMFGYEAADWKPFTLFDGTEVLVPGKFNTDPLPNGDLLQYPEGDKSAPPSGRMPKGGFYFDAIIRQDPIDEAKLDPADNLEEFAVLSDQEVRDLADAAAKLADRTTYGVVLILPGTAFGDIALVPAPWMKHPKGIRDVAEWYMSTACRRDYVMRVFEGQCRIALENIDLLAEAIGDRVQVAYVTGTDFGTQRGPFISPQAYRELFKPFHKAVNDRIHQKTSWKTFIHSCGSVVELIPDFIEAGFDILNPVQTSAAGMDPRTLKRQFGNEIVFWGGGVDTQKTLPFGTPQEVYGQVRERIEIFNDGGGYVFGAIHNVQANVPVENVLAMFKAVRDSYGAG